MNKLSAMIRYEILMAWRRRSLPILWLLLVVGVVFFALLMRNVNQQNSVIDDVGAVITNADAPEWAQGIDPLIASHTITLTNLLIAGMVFYTVGVVLLMAEIIPLDRQFKVRELLDTLPISRATYLGGKVMSAWTGILIGIVGGGLICGLLIYAIIGAYDPRIFVATWTALLLPQGFVAAALTVLAASFVGSRRGAVLVGLVVMPFVLALSFSSVISFAGVGALIEPIYAVGVLMMPGAETNAVIAERISTVLMLYGGVLVAAWSIVWLSARIRQA